jgi:hypothetical protein
MIFNWQSWTFFLVLSNLVPLGAQWQENFADDLLSSPSWMGDLGHFSITPSGDLQLAAMGAGQSCIFSSIEVELPWLWEVSFAMDFNPSSQNYLEIILWSSQAHKDAPIQLVLRIGEDGSDDSLVLIERQNGIDHVVASGINGSLAINPTAQVLAVLDRENIMHVYQKLNTQLCYEHVYQLPVDQNYENPGYAGLCLVYTKSRSTSFLFDYFFALPLNDQNHAPKILDVMEGLDQIKIKFNEQVVGMDGFPTGKYELYPGLRQPDTASFLEGGTAMHLSFSPRLQEQVHYTLEISQLQDFTGNELDTSISFRLDSEPVPGDIIFNEILFDPSPGGSEFVELINVSDKWLRMAGIVILNKRNGQVHPVDFPQSLAPGQFALLCEDPADIRNRYKYHESENIYRNELPTLGNLEGHLILMDPEHDDIIDEFNYDASLHHPLLKSVKGVSLERISPTVSGNDLMNWGSASSLVGFGTPGLPNSIRSVESQGPFFVLKNKVFIQGNNDHEILMFHFDYPDYVVSVDLFTTSGSKIAQITKARTVGSSGHITWDGTGLSGQPVRTGLYLLSIRWISISAGSTGADKLPLVILSD